jgi:hypothetical protein
MTFVKRKYTYGYIHICIACRYIIFNYYYHCKKIYKTIPLQAWAGPEDSRKLRIPDFKTVGTYRW